MKYILTLSIFFVLSFNWYLLEQDELGFSLEFPQEPVLYADTIASEMGNIYSYRYVLKEVENEKSRIYSATCLRYPANTISNYDQEFKMSLVDDTIAGVIESNDAILIYQAPIQHNSYVGKIARYNLANDSMMRTKIAIRNDQLFVIQYIAEISEREKDYSQKFLNSFEVIQ